MKRPHRTNLAYTDIGGLLREARREAGLSQAALASEIGTTQSVISRWERGGDVPRIETLVRVLRACGYEADLALRRHDDVDRAQILLHLAMTPEGRIHYLRGMQRFARAARAAKRVDTRASS